MRRREREWTGWAAGLAAGLVWIVFVVALSLAVYGLFDVIIDSICGTCEPAKVERQRMPGLVWMKGER